MLVVDDHLKEDAIDKNEQVFFSLLGPARGGLAKLQGFTENDMLMKIIGAHRRASSTGLLVEYTRRYCPPAGPPASLAMLVATTCCASDNNGE